MPRPSGGMQRALREILVGSQRTRAAREARDRETRFTETDQQFQVPINGTGHALPGFTEVEVAFDHPFYYAPGQRDADFETPHLSGVGGEINQPLLIGASVKQWVVDDDNGGITGAVVRIAVYGSAEAVEYEGVAHLTFQGFASLAEDEVVNEAP